MNTLETIWQGLLGASGIEQIATLLGLTAVWLATRQRLANFPIGMVQVVLTGIIFARHGLFADMTLQAVYFVALAYGWWCWTHPGERARLPVRRPPLARLVIQQLVPAADDRSSPSSPHNVLQRPPSG